MFLLGCPYYQPEKPEFHSPSILRVSKCLEKSFSRNPLTQNNRLRLLVSRNPRFRRTSLILSLRESSPCGALEAPNDSMNQENRPVISKFEWLACLETADYAVSRLSVFLWIPWNPLEAVESRSRPCRVAVANVLGATKVFSVNLLYGFPARLLVFLVILQSERSKFAWNRPMEGGGDSDLWRDHLLLRIETEKSNHEIEIDRKHAKYEQIWSLKTRFGAESFIWQEIKSQNRKVYRAEGALSSSGHIPIVDFCSVRILRLYRGPLATR